MCAMHDFLAKLTDSALLLTVSVVLCCSSCQKRTEMEAYYFPLDVLEEGQVYTYESLSEPKMLDDIWYYKTLQRDGEIYLAGQSYDENWRVSQLVVEKRIDLGMITDSVTLFSPDSSGRDLAIQVKVTNRATYPFYRDRSDTLLYRIQWTEPGTGLEYTLDRQRVYEKDTVVSFDGKELAAVSFVLEEELETFYEHDGATRSGWGGQEIYAQGIGLFYYRKEIGEGFTREYRLKSIEDGEEYFAKLESEMTSGEERSGN